MGQNSKTKNFLSTKFVMAGLVQALDYKFPDNTLE